MKICLVGLAALLAPAAGLAGCSGAPSPQSVTRSVIGACATWVTYDKLAWSPDSQRILYTTQSIDSPTQINVMSWNGRDDRRLSSGPWGDFPGGWSPDGSHIVFASDRDGNLEVYTMNADPGASPDTGASGSGQTRLTSDPDGDGEPAWSPGPGSPVGRVPAGDGETIAFVSDRNGDYELYTMSTGGEGVKRLGPVATYAFSPAGDRIAFAAYVDGGTEMFVMDANGANQTRLTYRPGDDSSPVWSPDGQRVAFVSFDDGKQDIYVADVDGGGLTRLTDHPEQDDHPVWSPDGSRILFVSTRGVSAETYVMNADPGSPRDRGSGASGSAQTRLTDPPFDDDGPAWSPDGKYIAFISRRDGEDEIYRMNADGSHQTRLTRNPGNQKCLKWPF